MVDNNHYKYTPTTIETNVSVNIIRLVCLNLLLRCKNKKPKNSPIVTPTICFITAEPLAKTFPNQLINCQLNTKPTALQTKITHYLT